MIFIFLGASTSKGKKCVLSRCQDHGKDCCAPGDEFRGCKGGNWHVAGDNRQDWCSHIFGNDAVYKCCKNDPPVRIIIPVVLVGCFIMWLVWYKSKNHQHSSTVVANNYETTDRSPTRSSRQLNRNDNSVHYTTAQPINLPSAVLSPDDTDRNTSTNATGSRFCSNCGTTTSGKPKFCSKCGSRLKKTKSEV